MITKEGYSKNKSLVPEGIAITWTKEIAEKQYGSIENLKREFIAACNNPVEFWMQECRIKPKYDIAYVYIIYQNHVIYECHYVGWAAKGELIENWEYTGEMPWAGILIAGPVIEAPVTLYRPGFRGYRYTTKLF